jgi:hypothetical protein
MEPDDLLRHIQAQASVVWGNGMKGPKHRWEILCGNAGAGVLDVKRDLRGMATTTER